jgi:hypothetical protein
MPYLRESAAIVVRVISYSTLGSASFSSLICHGYAMQAASSAKSAEKCELPLDFDTGTPMSGTTVPYGHNPDSPLDPGNQHPLIAGFFFGLPGASPRPGG